MEAVSLSISIEEDRDWAEPVDAEEATAAVDGFLWLSPETHGAGGERLIAPYEELEWTSSDPWVLTNEIEGPEGLRNSFYGVSPGTATVTARFRDLSASIDVVVSAGS